MSHNALKIFKGGEYTCVLCKGDIVLTSKERGVKPLVNWIENGENYSGFSAADKIIGKAAAYLYILMGVTSVHASVMSTGAFELLSEYSIEVSYDLLTNSIINRKGNDICPMEKAVADAVNSLDAFNKIKKTVILLSGGENLENRK